MFSLINQMLVLFFALMLLGEQEAMKRPWKEGKFNPKHQRQNKTNDFDLPHAKTPVIFHCSATVLVILD